MAARWPVVAWLLASRAAVTVVGSGGNESGSEDGGNETESSTNLQPLPSLPPEVDFIGRSAKLRIYPGGKKAENATWIKLEFGKIQEFTPDLKAVKERTIKSLAGDRGVKWTQENRVVAGAPALVTRMELPITYRGSFKQTCKTRSTPDRKRDKDRDKEHDDDDDDDDDDDGRGGQEEEGEERERDGPGSGSTGPQGGDDHQDSDDHQEGDDLDRDVRHGGSNLISGQDRRLTSTMFVAVEVFVFTEDATLWMGIERIDVKKGQLKFNIESNNWPFCDTNNSLIFAMHLQRPTDGRSGREGERSFYDKDDDQDDNEHESAGGDKKYHDRREERRSRRKRFRARAGGRADVAMDFPEVALIDGVTQNTSISMYMERMRTTLLFQFPPFTKTMLYDPTVGFEPEAQALPPSEDCTLCNDEVLAEETNADDGLQEAEPSVVSAAAAASGSRWVRLAAALLGAVVLR